MSLFILSVEWGQKDKQKAILSHWVRTETLHVRCSDPSVHLSFNTSDSTNRKSVSGVVIRGGGSAVWLQPPLLVEFCLSQLLQTDLFQGTLAFSAGLAVFIRMWRYWLIEVIKTGLSDSTSVRKHRKNTVQPHNGQKKVDEALLINLQTSLSPKRRP